MKNNNIVWSFILVFILVLVTSVTVIGKKISSPSEIETLKAKTKDEMSYLDGKISTMMHTLNNIQLTNYAVEEREVTSKSQTSESEELSEGNSDTETSSQTESSNQEKSSSQTNKQAKNQTELTPNIILNNTYEPNWEELEVTVENLYSSWSTILLDLYKLNMNSEEILRFSQLLDQLTLQVKEKKKTESLDVLSQMYSCIVGYVQSFSEDTFYPNMIRTRESVLKAYVQVEQNNWEEVKTQLQNAESSYAPIVNNIARARGKRIYDKQSLY